MEQQSLAGVAAQATTAELVGLEARTGEVWELAPRDMDVVKWMQSNYSIPERRRVAVKAARALQALQEIDPGIGQTLSLERDVLPKLEVRAALLPSTQRSSWAAPACLRACCGCLLWPLPATHGSMRCHACPQPAAPTRLPGSQT